MTTYQDVSGQSSCKTCESQSTKTMTSTARGAEGCFVDYSMFTINESIISFHIQTFTTSSENELALK